MFNAYLNVFKPQELVTSEASSSVTIESGGSGRCEATTLDHKRYSRNTKFGNFCKQHHDINSRIKQIESVLTFSDPEPISSVEVITQINSLKDGKASNDSIKSELIKNGCGATCHSTHQIV